jgi:NitT/TauT family transport system substrate-binding protein
MLVAACLLLAGGCGLMRGQQNSADAEGKTQITVGAMPLVNLVPLQLAIDPKYHFFGDEGLFVTPKTINNGGAGLVELLNGEADVTYVSVVTVAKAQAKAPEKDPAKRYTIIAPASANARLAMALVAKENGPIKTVRDLKGKRVAINQTGGLADAMTRSALKDNGVAAGDVHMPPVDFPNMPVYLENDQVDAALVAEPYVTLAAQQAGAIPLVNFQDTEAKDLPLDCYVTTEKYAAEHPAEIGEFQRALRNAANLAHDDHQAAVDEVPHFIKDIPVGLPQLLNFPAFPLAVDERNYQRVPDLMKNYGLADDFKIGPMIYTPPSPSPSPSPSGSSATPTPTK